MKHELIPDSRNYSQEEIDYINEELAVEAKVREFLDANPNSDLAIDLFHWVGSIIAHESPDLDYDEAYISARYGVNLRASIHSIMNKNNNKYKT